MNKKSGGGEGWTYQEMCQEGSTYAVLSQWHGPPSWAAILTADEVALQLGVRGGANEPQPIHIWTSFKIWTLIFYISNITVFVAWDFLQSFHGWGLRMHDANPLLRPLEAVGPENRDFFGPWNGNERRAIRKGGPWKYRLFWAQVALVSLAHSPL